MFSVLNYQLSVSGAAIHYQTSSPPTLIERLTSRLNQIPEAGPFSPRAYYMPDIDRNSNELVVTPYLALASRDLIWHIEMHDDHVEISWRYPTETDQESERDAHLTPEQFGEVAGKLLGAIMLSERLLGSRLGMYVNAVKGFNSLDTALAIGKNLLQQPKFYQENALHEWGAKFNTQPEIQIEGTREKTNVILDLSRLQTKDGNFPIVQAQLDINTVPWHTEKRFQSLAAVAFAHAAASVAQRLLDDTEALMTDSISSKGGE